MMFTFAHQNLNVTDLSKSIAFYEKALGLTVKKRKPAADGSFELCFLTDGTGNFELELTWLKDHPQAYDLGENEIHLAFRADDYDAAYVMHKQMGCICYENPKMGIYFISDPDGYWLEVVPTR